MLDLYLRSENIPIFWKKHFMKIANEKDKRYIKLKISNQHRHETHFIIYK